MGPTGIPSPTTTWPACTARVAYPRKLVLDAMYPPRLLLFLLCSGRPSEIWSRAPPPNPTHKIDRPSSSLSRHHALTVSIPIHPPSAAAAAASPESVCLGSASRRDISTSPSPDFPSPSPRPVWLQSRPPIGLAERSRRFFLDWKSLGVVGCAVGIFLDWGTRSRGALRRMNSTAGVGQCQVQDWRYLFLLCGFE